MNDDDDDEVLQVDDFRPTTSGTYAVQALYSNGAGTRNTGIACALKWLVVYRLSPEGGCTRESRQVVVMPQNSEYRWDVWNWSTPAKVQLAQGSRYAIVLCDDGDGGDEASRGEEEAPLMNLTHLDHFTPYTNNGRMLGGGEAVANYANIARIRLRRM
jgi:hypothetical protein